MKLDITSLRQESGSVECGLVVLEMLYSYYKKDKSIGQIRREISIVDVGTFAPQLGVNILDFGLSVEIITRNPLLVDRTDIELTQEDLLKKFKDKVLKMKEDDNKTSMQYFISFMEKGGKIKVKIPDITDIKTEIEASRPLIAMITSAPLYSHNIAEELGKPFSYTYHAVLVTGIEGDQVTVHDPYWGEDGGIKTYPAEEFFYALHSDALGGNDNDCFITVKSK